MIDLNALRGIADAARQIAIPIRTTTVKIRRRVWASSLGLGTPTDTDITLAPYIKVRQVKTRDVATSGGRLEIGDVIVGPITPVYSSGGYSIDDIAPQSPNQLTEITYVLTGALEGDYHRIQANTDKPFRYELILRRKNTTP